MIYKSVIHFLEYYYRMGLCFSLAVFLSGLLLLWILKDINTEFGNIFPTYWSDIPETKWSFIINTINTVNVGRLHKFCFRKMWIGL